MQRFVHRRMTGKAHVAAVKRLYRWQAWELWPDRWGRGHQGDWSAWHRRERWRQGSDAALKRLSTLMNRMTGLKRALCRAGAEVLNGEPMSSISDRLQTAHRTSGARGVEYQPNWARWQVSGRWRPGASAY